MQRYTIEETKRMWFISDPHFDHANIIKYCHRPFDSVEEMNRTMLDNWNRTVTPNDWVCFLGDMSFGRHSRPPQFWLNRLNGRKVFIKGSHDRGIRLSGALATILNQERVTTREVIEVDGTSFLLVHDPFGPKVNGWDGWIIHGHTHSEVFLNVEERRINVCVEAIGYKPVSLHRILEIMVSFCFGWWGGEE